MSDFWFYVGLGACVVALLALWCLVWEVGR